MKKIILIFFILILAFLISTFSVKNIFFANSPRIKQNLIADLRNQVKNNSIRLFALLRGVNFKKNNNVAFTLKDKLQTITKGVRAASENSNTYATYDFKLIEKAEITYLLSNGKRITLIYVKGMDPPPKEMIEQIKNIE